MNNKLIIIIMAIDVFNDKLFFIYMCFFTYERSYSCLKFLIVILMKTVIRGSIFYHVLCNKIRSTL